MFLSLLGRQTDPEVGRFKGALMFRAFGNYDATEFLAITSATLFVVCSFLAFYLF